MPSTAPLSRRTLLRCGAVVLAWKLLVLLLLVKAGLIGPRYGCLLCTVANDTPTYFDPIETLLRTGTYAPDLRMPGYGAVYLLTRAFLDVPAAYDLLVLLQTLVSTISVVVLMQVVHTLTGSRRWAFATLVGYPLLFGLHGYDAFLLTESFSASALIFFFACLLAFARGGGPGWAGAFATWLVFLKPVCLPVLLAGAVAVAFLRTGRSLRMKALLAFLAPFLLAEIPWTLHNARNGGGFHPLLRNIYLASERPDMTFEGCLFVRSFGGSIVWWEDPRAEVYYFNLYGDPQVRHDIALPDAVLRVPGAAEGLPALAEGIRLARDTTLDATVRAMHAERAFHDLRAWRARYEEHAPFDHHVLAPWRHLRRLIADQRGTPFPFRLPFAEMPVHQKVLKLFLHGTGALLPVLGAIAALLLVVAGRGPRALRWLVAFTVAFGLGVFPLLYLSEPRYWVCFSSFSLIACAWAWPGRRVQQAVPPAARALH